MLLYCTVSKLASSTFQGLLPIASLNSCMIFKTWACLYKFFFFWQLQSQTSQPAKIRHESTERVSFFTTLWNWLNFAPINVKEFLIVTWQKTPQKNSFWIALNIAVKLAFYSSSRSAGNQDCVTWRTHSIYNKVNYCNNETSISVFL